jgi:hypothetical protein
MLKSLTLTLDTQEAEALRKVAELGIAVVTEQRIAVPHGKEAALRAIRKIGEAVEEAR